MIVESRDVPHEVIVGDIIKALAEGPFLAPHEAKDHPQ
jgi:hypothetical protein